MSSPDYRKRVEPEAPSSSHWLSRRSVLWIVCFVLIATDLVVMFYGGYLSDWQLLTQSPGIFWAVVGLTAAIVLIASAYEKIFPVGVRKTISRNAPLVSALIALLGVLIAQVVNAHLASTTQENQQVLDEKARQNSQLQDYLSTVGQLPTNPDSEADVSAQAQTLTVLPNLNPEQKRTVMQFLYQADLINRDNPRIRLFYADLTSANLKGTDAQENRFVLDNSNLRGANLSEADLSFISLEGSNLRYTHLVGTDFSNATLSNVDLSRAYFENVDLSGADLSDADLSDTNLSSVDLSGADLSSADLSGVEGVTDEELEEQARSLEGTTMPDGTRHG